jgi:FKBP-type peptidyl-prolyl cis-trans isomerase
MRWIVMLVISVAGLCRAEAPAQTDKDKLSYAMGMDLGNQLKAKAVDIDTDVFVRALRTALAGDKTLLTDAEAKAIITELQKAILTKQAAQTKAVGEKNKQAGEAFLAENKAKPGVVVLPSGLQYKIVKEGTGKKPTATDTVICQYRGTLIGGKEFDSSFKRGEPATFPVSKVIKGWTEILQLMPVGSVWQVFIPSSLAYGEGSPTPDIGPNSTLIFEIELVQS